MTPSSEEALFGMTNGILEHWNLATMSRVASWRGGHADGTWQPPFQCRGEIDLASITDDNRS